MLEQRDQNRCDVCWNVASETLNKLQCEDSEFKMTIYEIIKQSAADYDGYIETEYGPKQGGRSRATNENTAEQCRNL